jgi:hypothetical protein
MKILVRDAQKEIIFKNLDNVCLKCEKDCENEGTIFQCPVNITTETRQGKRVSSNGSFFLCCNKSVAKTTKLFKEKLEMLVYSIPTIKEIKEKVYLKTKQFEQDKYLRIVHNLRTINAQSIQEQFSLIPQDVLAENYFDQLRYVQNIITENPEKAAITFLRLAKNNSSIKTEFVTHEKLSIENPVLSVNKHNIRKVILNVYHAFSLEFKDKNVRLEIFSDDKTITFDYDTIRVAFYHMFHNAAKYIKSHSVLKIECIDEISLIYVIFKMQSIHIEEFEILKIFDDNYSGVRVVEKNKQGAGLGMGLIKKALELNNFTISIKAGKDIEKRNKVDYSHNEFRIAFKR